MAELTVKEIEEAIQAITSGGQSYKIGSRSLTRANLSELRALRKELLAEEDAAADADTASLMPGVARGIFSGR